MKQAFEQQLSRGDELPRVPGLVAYLKENVGEEEVPGLYERFMWEMRREKEPRQALQAAKFALSYSPTKHVTLEQGLGSIQQAISREPLLLQPGEHQSISEQLEVINLWDHQIWTSRNELTMGADQVAKNNKLIVVLDDQPPSARLNEGKLIWNIPVRGDNAEDSWRALWEADHKGEIPEWVSAYSSFRHLADSNTLPNEHQIRSARTRELVQDILMSNSYGPSPEELSSLDQEEIDWAFDAFDRFFEHYTAEPRLALACQSLKDFSALADWQNYGPQGQRALLEAVTGNSPLISSALHSVDRMRMGSLAFTGDPDRNGDDLLSAVLPAQECTVVLKPEALQRTLFFGGVPHPTAHLPVPSIKYGYCNTVAIGKQVVDMLKTRAYLCLTPATDQSIRDYFQGRGQEIELEDATGNPAFQALVTATMIRRKQGEDNPMVKAALRVAAAHAIYVGLNNDPLQDPMAGVHLGGLSLDDVEQIVVAVHDTQEWEDYHRSGKLPAWLRAHKKFFDSKGIRLRARSNVGHGSMAVAE